VATYHDVDARDLIKVAAFRPDATGLTEVENLQNPAIGQLGIEPTTNGFVQAGFKGLLVWSTAAAPLVK
jgi:hypothetical protein